MKKIPPHSKEAEQAVIGSLLLDSRKIDEVFEIVQPHDFYFPENQIIFKEIVNLHKKAMPIDPVLLISKLQLSAPMIHPNIECYIYDMANSTPSANNIIPYAMIVRERSILREIIQILEQMKHDCFLGFPAKEILDATELRVKNIKLLDEMIKNAEESSSIECPKCGMVSYHSDDIKNKYCGNCHEWHENMKLEKS